MFGARATFQRHTQVPRVKKNNNNNNWSVFDSSWQLDFRKIWQRYLGLPNVTDTMRQLPCRSPLLFVRPHQIWWYKVIGLMVD